MLHFLMLNTRPYFGGCFHQMNEDVVFLWYSAEYADIIMDGNDSGQHFAYLTI